jgi:hypothetical protein
LIETSEPDDGGADSITTLTGDDIIFGGTGSDTIRAGDGIDVIFGDQGEVAVRAAAPICGDLLDMRRPWFEGILLHGDTYQDDWRPATPTSSTARAAETTSSASRART